VIQNEEKQNKALEDNLRVPQRHLHFKEEAKRRLITSTVAKTKVPECRCLSRYFLHLLNEAENTRM